MKKKIFLTSMLVLSFACPAMAEDGNEFIENGDTCNIDNLGTSTNNDTANIEAIWNLVSVPCSAGQYFNASTASCETCSAGSWCVAGTYDVENNQTGAGSTLCSTLANGEYTLSADGSSENTQCYRNCSTSDVAHSTGVSGGYYYGGNNQCEPTSCASGWHIKTGEQTNIDVAEIIGDNNGVNSAYINYEGTFRENSWTGGGCGNDCKGQNYYEISDANSWAVYYGDGIGALMGSARCSTQVGYQDTVNNQNNWTYNNPTTFETLEDETGQSIDAKYCYCNITGYKDENGVFHKLDSAWVFVYGYDYGIKPNQDYMGTACNAGCSSNCMTGMIRAKDYNWSTQEWTTNQNLMGYRTTRFDTVIIDDSKCGSNVVKINLYNDSVANNGTKTGTSECNYGRKVGSMGTPTKPGYRFTGWTLRN